MTDGVILVGGEALYDLVDSGDDSLSAHPGGGPFNAARTIGRLRGAGRLPRAPVDRPLRHPHGRHPRAGRRAARRGRAHGRPDHAGGRGVRRAGQRELPLLHRGHVGAGAEHPGGAGRTARERRRAARRHARAGARADGHGAGGRRRAARGGGAGGRRRELPAVGDRRSRRLPPAPGARSCATPTCSRSARRTSAGSPPARRPSRPRARCWPTAGRRWPCSRAAATAPWS